MDTLSNVYQGFCMISNVWFYLMYIPSQIWLPNITDVLGTIDDHNLISVAFDEGSYCDSLEPHTVSFISEEHSENCPVNVAWEGGHYTGIYKGSNKLYWYKIKTIDKMDTVEVERKNIIKD